MATSRAIRRAYDVRLAPLGVNLTEASLLAFVGEQGPVTQTQLAERLGMNRASTGSVVDAMLGRGLVMRDPSATDRRVWLVRLTDEGRALAAEAAAVDVALREELRAGLGRAERQQLARTLVRLQANLAAVLNDSSSS